MWLQRITGFLGMVLCAKGIWHEDTGTGLGMLFIGLVLLSILFTSDWALDDIDVMVGVFLCSNWRALFKMPVYFIQRMVVLGRAKKGWKKRCAVLPVSKKIWKGLAVADRVELVNAIISFEIEEQRVELPCYVVMYSKKVDSNDLWIQIDAAGQRILWNGEVVNYYSLRKILVKMILAIQQYKFYGKCQWEEKRILNSFSAKRGSEQMLYWKAILFNKIAYTQDVTPYDIITGQYARAKSAWYCGK